MSVGQSLAAARSDAGLSVDEVAARTRIRATLVRQIEADDIEACGGLVYARGHIRNLAAAVGTEPGPLLAEFDRTHRSAPAEAAETAKIFDVDTSHAERRRPNWVAAMVVALLAVSGIAGYSLLNGAGPTQQTLTQRPAASAEPVAPPVASPAPTTESPPAPPAPDAVAQAQPEGVSLRLTVTGARSWVRVSDATNTTLFQGQLDSGEVREFTHPSELRLIIGDSGAVTLTVNGEDLGVAGAAGAVTRVAFGPGDPSGDQAG